MPGAQRGGEFNPETCPAWAAVRGPLGAAFSAPPRPTPPPSMRGRPQQAPREKGGMRELQSPPLLPLCQSPLRGLGVQHDSPGRGLAARGPCRRSAGPDMGALGVTGAAKQHRDKQGVLGRWLRPGPGLYQGVWPAKAAIYPEESKAGPRTGICARTFTAALFTIAKGWKPLKCPLCE